VPVVSTTPASCTAAGTATINNYNLSLSYIFTPAGPTAGAGGAISGMTAGTSYTVESTDGSCSSGQSASFSIAAQLPVPVAAISGSLSYCTGGNTTLTASGGTSYFWDDAGNSTTATITVTQGTYTVTVSNSNGCMATAMATVTEIATLPVTITGVLSYCTGGNTTLTASGGIGYMWNDPANSTTPSITVTAGTYVVSAADANGCTGTASATVTEVTAATVTITGTLSYCAGGNTTITASGAVSYLWNDAGNSTTPAVTVTQGTYTVTGTDANSCSATAIATVTENALPTISVSGSLTYCTGGSTTLTANGGTGYVWDNGATTPTVTVTQGTYTVTATDVNGCTGTASATVTESTNLSVTISGVLTYCPGANTTLTASGGPSYTWSNGGTADNVTVTQGTYTVTASDAGCTGTASATVTELPALPVSISGVLTYCPGANTTLTASGGTSYMWSNGGIADNITVTQGTYTVTASDAGCNGTASTVVTEIPVSPVNLGNDVTACEETSVTLDAGSGYTSYVWTSGETSQSITPQTSGTYTVTVLDANNCSASGSIDVAFNSCQEMTVFIPNAFSPDGDGNNDVFQYYLTGVVTAEIKVFNRWGEKVFETNNTSQYWDGTNKGVKCNMGVFVYSIRVLSNTGTAKSYKGSLTLLR
jgi:gliding motility-associated-like protein